MKALGKIPQYTYQDNFISHMVQMKVKNSPSPRTVHHALYPTWFRWKCSRHVWYTSRTWLYIPHGSDERQLSRWFQKTLQTLYPTWFRWKASRRATLYEFASLYIPHGSDESQAKIEFKDVLKCFISHMVQMKGNLPNADAILIAPLYPTWFRWKPPRWHEQSDCIYLYIPHGSDESC